MLAQLDKRYIKLSKKKALKRFLSYFLFEGRPHSTTGQWFNPVVFFLLRLLLKFDQNTAVYKPIFIVGLGRSGTTVLGLIMSMHKDLAYLNEPKAIWSLIDERTDTLDDYCLNKGQLDLDASHVTETIVVKARRIFANYLRCIGRSRLLDKFPEHVFRVDYLLSVFPDAKIIFISRTGNDAVASIAKWSLDHETNSADDKEDWWGRNDAKWRYICNQSLSSDPYREQLSHLDLESLDPLNRAALEWVITIDKGLDVMDKFDDKVFHVRYEELLENPENILRSIIEYCELSHDPQLLEYAKHKIFQQTTKPVPILNDAVASLFSATAARLQACSPINSVLEP